MRLLEKMVAVIAGVTDHRFEVVVGFETKINPLRSGRAISDRC